VTFGTEGRGGLAIADLNGDGSADIAVAGVGLLFNRGNGPAALLAPNLLGFGNVAVGYRVSGPVTLTNSGTKTLTISGITLTGRNSSDFSQANTCGSSVAVKASCTFSITFKPSALGLRTASIQVGDNAFNTPQIISLSGTGVTTAPIVTLAPGTLSFGNQVVNVASASQIVTLTNTGNAALTITNIKTTGADSSEFTQTSTCGSSVAAGANCTISVTFTPAAAGSRSATLSITDNAPFSPQTVKLSGDGTTSLGLGVASGSSSSQTVTAGNTASYTLTIGGQGMSGTAAFTCTGAPTGAQCSVPASKNVSATTASTFTVSVSTTRRDLAALAPGARSPFQWALAMAVLGLLMLPVRAQNKGASFGLLRCLPFALLLAICSCGGSSTPPGNPNGTPAGSYTLSVTATSGAANQSTSLTLIVQ
jgi:hypothetical protein